MILLKTPTDEVRPLSFWLAMEEYAARRLPAHEWFFTWQAGPAVIIGRNQDLEAEVNTDYCRDHGIRIFRRKSGGGCVYADMSNLMLSYVTPDENPTATFNRYLQMVADFLQTLGIDAVVSGHNDVLLPSADGTPPRKVSGNALWHMPDRTIAHGTLLYDTDMQNMMHAITPPREKLTRHGVESVRQRICFLSHYTSLPLSEVILRLHRSLCRETWQLGEADVAEILKIEEAYDDPDWILHGKLPKT